MIPYETWRTDVFGQGPGTDPVMAELPQDTYDIPDEIALDYIDRALVDPDIHTLFTKEQIGIGLQTLYDNSCSDFPFAYIQVADESRKVRAITNLSHLYSNFFERYCTSPVNRVGYDLEEGAIGYLCYMLWDIFVLYPGSGTKAMAQATVDVMKQALDSRNDQCVVSAIHGLGHWAEDLPAAVDVLDNWLVDPSTPNTAIREYARLAKTGCIQ